MRPLSPSRLCRPCLVAAATAALALGTLSAAAQSRAQSLPPPSQSVLQQDVDQFTAIGATSTIAEVFHGNTSIRARSGVAKLGTNTPVAWDTHFRMASVTKTFVAVVVLQLVGEGKLSLDDKVERWLPGLVRGNGNDGRQITVRQVLQMTSGLFDYASDAAFFSLYASPEAWTANRNKQWTPRELVQIALSHPPLFAPGAEWSYSNTNYILAGLIVKAVTGNEWDYEVAKRITFRLGLKFTDTYGPGNNPYILPPFTHGYDLFGVDGAYTDVTFMNMSWGYSAGALISTTSDLNRFLTALMKGQLLKPAQLAQMKTLVPIEGSGGAGYGLGIAYVPLPCGVGFWTHDGTTFGYRTITGVLSDGSRSVIASVATHDSLYVTTFAENYSPAYANLVINALCGS